MPLKQLVASPVQAAIGQCPSGTAARKDRSQRGHQGSHKREDQIEDADEDSKDPRKHQHHRRGVDQILSGGPDHPTELATHIAQESPESLPHPRSSLPSRKLLQSTRKKAGLAGLEPATPGFGDRCSTKLSYRPTPRLARLFVSGVPAAKPAVLLEFDSTGMSAPVLRRRVVAATALLTLQRNLLSWHLSSPKTGLGHRAAHTIGAPQSVTDITATRRRCSTTRTLEPMTRIELVTSSLPRTRSTD